MSKEFYNVFESKKNDESKIDYITTVVEKLGHIVIGMVDIIGTRILDMEQKVSKMETKVGLTNLNPIPLPPPTTPESLMKRQNSAEQVRSPTIMSELKKLFEKRK